MEQLLRLNFSGFSPGWRETLLALIAVLALYMLLEVLRMRRLQRQKAKAAASAQEPVLNGGAAETTQQADAGNSAEATNPCIESEADWPQVSSTQAQETFMRGVESELAQMRDEIDILRAEFAALREDIGRETARLRASQTVSPLYNDAMQMAIGGYGAEMIAERCGISRAEAELVVSLVKNREG